MIGRPPRLYNLRSIYLPLEVSLAGNLKCSALVQHLHGPRNRLGHSVSHIRGVRDGSTCEGRNTPSFLCDVKKPEKKKNTAFLYNFLPTKANEHKQQPAREPAQSPPKNPKPQPDTLKKKKNVVATNSARRGSIFFFFFINTRMAGLDE